MELVGSQNATHKSAERVLGLIQDTETMLHNLADQLLDTEKDRWNVIIGDDAGGRLPAHFVNEVMKGDGRELPTFFVASSRVYRSVNGNMPYDLYFQHISDQVGEPLRPLIVTESVGTGETASFIRDRLRCHSSREPEIAAVAVSGDHLAVVEYAGGVGEFAAKLVWGAYESPPKLSMARTALKAVWVKLPRATKRSIRSNTNKRITPPSFNALVGIEVDPSSEVPVVRVAPKRSASISTQAFRLMDSMARAHQAGLNEAAPSIPVANSLY